MDPTKFCVNLGKSVTENLAIIRQAFREESMSHKENPNSPRPKKGRQVMSKVKRMLIILTYRGC
jgi:hypothetical protein